jgi:hypothetical protein
MAEAFLSELIQVAKKVLGFLRNSKVHRHVHKITPLDRILYASSIHSRPSPLKLSAKNVVPHTFYGKDI